MPVFTIRETYRVKRRLLIMQTDLEFMQAAIAIAEENLSSLYGGPFGCVIVRDGEVLSAEPNTVNRDCDPTAHAEMNAIRKAARKIKDIDLSGCILYTSTQPCPMCLSAIYWANIRMVFYGNTKDDAARAGFGDQFILDQLCKETDRQDVNFKRIAEKQAIQAFKKWIASDSEFNDKVQRDRI